MQGTELFFYLPLTPMGFRKNHALLIVDSCYSGTLLRGGAAKAGAVRRCLKCLGVFAKHLVPVQPGLKRVGEDHAISEPFRNTEERRDFSKG